MGRKTLCFLKDERVASSWTTVPLIVRLAIETPLKSRNRGFAGAFLRLRFTVVLPRKFSPYKVNLQKLTLGKAQDSLVRN